ncbi:helix-turn-helix domain-containing protein [Streptomyces katrae]|uniref:helix-turn-helix domain-containing protein n=1 Tax=Streptomyces katrae TaxID=68223 RepID=UPI000569DA5B|nr:helix-turn-helix domain-containing protein [Streptomyces katrae]
MTDSVEEPRLPSPKERRRLREAAGLTYEDVATAVGVTVSTVRSWEAGRTGPRGRKRAAYASFLTTLQPPAPAAPAPAAQDAVPTGPGSAADDGTSSAAGQVAPPGPAHEADADADADADAHADAQSTGAAGLEAPPVRMAGGVRPFGMGGPGPRTRPPVAAERATRPPMFTPRHEARVNVRATAQGIGTPGRATPGPSGRSPEHDAPVPTSEQDPPHTPSGTTPEDSPQPPEQTPADATATAPEGHEQAPADATEQPGALHSAAGPEGAGQAADGAEGHTAGGDTEARPGAEGEPEVPADGAADGPWGPREVFDALYEYAAPALTRQAYLLTGRRRLSQEAVERAFQHAWARWPEVATDPDPVGWVRAAAYEYALSPWHRFRRAHKHPDKAPAAPADRILMDAMLALPPVHRRTVLLYDGVGLDLPDTAAETEASTPTAGHRLLHAHATLADRIPELAAAPPERQSALLRERLGAVIPAVRLEPRAAAVVRIAAEHRAQRWTRAVLGLSAVLAVATAYTTATAPRQYEPPIAPGASVSGVPPLSGPQRLTAETRQLREKLRAHPAHRPERLAPGLE